MTSADFLMYRFKNGKKCQNWDQNEVYLEISTSFLLVLLYFYILYPMVNILARNAYLCPSPEICGVLFLPIFRSVPRYYAFENFFLGGGGALLARIFTIAQGASVGMTFLK